MNQFLCCVTFFALAIGLRADSELRIPDAATKKKNTEKRLMKLSKRLSEQEQSLIVLDEKIKNLIQKCFEFKKCEYQEKNSCVVLTEEQERTIAGLLEEQIKQLQEVFLKYVSTDREKNTLENFLKESQQEGFAGTWGLLKVTFLRRLITSTILHELLIQLERDFVFLVDLDREQNFIK
jgi:hypothetical protein